MNTIVNNEQDNISTKQRILDCAAELFAQSGYTETSIRNLANAVGVQGASIYNHFPSKNAILEYILEDYGIQNAQAYLEKDIASILRDDPTPDGVLACMQLTYPVGREAYYLNVLYVILQEQHRNDLIRTFVSEQFILRIESNVKSVIDELKLLHVIRQDTDPDFWMKAASGIMYAFASRRMLGIGDNAEDFTGMDMISALRYVFDLMLKTCAPTVSA